MQPRHDVIRLGKEERTRKTEENGLKRPPNYLSRLKKRWLGRMGVVGGFFSNPTVQKSMILAGTGLVLAVLLSPTFRLPPREYAAGDIALKDVRATRDMLVEDKASTEKRRRDAAEKVRSVYDFDPGVLEETEKRVKEAFDLLEELLPAQSLSLESRENRRRQIQEKLGVRLSPEQWKVLEKHFDPSLGEEILGLVRPLLKREIVSNRRLLEEDRKKGLTIRNIVNHEERQEDRVISIADLDIARRSIKRSSEGLIKTRGKAVAALVNRIAGALVRPNLTFNRQETEDRKNAAVKSVEPVYLSIKKGEILVREGDPIHPDQLVKLRALEALRTRVNTPMMIVGWMLVIVLILLILYTFSTGNIRKISPSTKDLLFLALLAVGTALSLRISGLVTGSLENSFSPIPSTSYYYLFPVAAGAMLVRIVLNSETALVFSVVISYLAGLLLDNSLFFFVYTFVGAVVGAHRVARCEERSTLIKAGLAVGLANVLVIFFHAMASGEPFSRAVIFQTLYNCGFGFMGGIFSAFVVLAITPIVETVFAYTTDIKLLELANSEQPILKSLIIQAPETHSHSVIIASLAEAAARAINANPILAKVAAYYHDIGKIKKPMYFIENQKGAENPHNRLTPSMSSLILLSHVKDGVTMARENRLGQKIIDIIQQHHGTSLISYFYEKAKEREKENPGVQEINEKDYRYPGPKPQTKEAGIVMLADAVEAASRTLSDPVPSRIKGLTQQIINKIFTDGQLDECELTLKDLHQIGNSFDRILNAIFHQRIGYPSPEEPGKKKKNNGNLGSRSAAHSKNRSQQNKKKNSENARNTRTGAKGPEYPPGRRSYYS
ncbi:MAG: HDIG domain-containing protein [Deltaproteobacteria bacterium]|nr:HDIG domain-containing protein [Deltaproteobacteria bacterium]